MSISCQILTYNSSNTIDACLNSLKSIDDILIGDLGSTDNTKEKCKGLRYFNFKDYNLNDARNELLKRSKNEWNLWLEPDEVVTIKDIIDDTLCRLLVCNNGFVSKSLRWWNKSENVSFINPVFEHIDKKTTNLSQNIIINKTFSYSKKDFLHKLSGKSLSYYKALNALPDYKTFHSCAEQYLFYNTEGIEVEQLRYQKAKIACYVDKNAQVAAENITYCLSKQWLFAEYWCLLGDIYYQIIGNPINAKKLYENAIFFGKYRSIKDEYPIELSKYKEYPEKMIKVISH